MESDRGDTPKYKLDDQTTLSNQANQARKQYDTDLVKIFRKLKENDSELANAALDVWNDEKDAANYLATPIPALAGKSPLEVLENGRRQEILDLLSRLKQGIFLKRLFRKA